MFFTYQPLRQKNLVTNGRFWQNVENSTKTQDFRLTWNMFNNMLHLCVDNKMPPRFSKNYAENLKGCHLQLVTNMLDATTSQKKRAHHTTTFPHFLFKKTNFQSTQCVVTLQNNVPRICSEHSKYSNFALGNTSSYITTKVHYLSSAWSSLICNDRLFENPDDILSLW